MVLGQSTVFSGVVVLELAVVVEAGLRMWSERAVELRPTHNDALDSMTYITRKFNELHDG